MTHDVVIEQFDTIDALIRANNTRRENSVFKGQELSSKTGSQSFTGTKSYDEAETLLRTGWTEMLEEFKKGSGDMRQVRENVSVNKRLPELGVVGYAPNVPNAIMGLPQSMISTKKTMQKVKAIRLIYCMSVNCGWRKEELMECSITVVKLLNLLELQGIRVQFAVDIIDAACGKDRSVCRVVVKNWRDALDLKKIAFPSAHPSMFRRIAFRWLETCPQIKNSSYRSGYGRSPFDDYEKDLKVMREDGLLEENDYYINPELCRDCKQDIAQIVKRCGMNGLNILKEDRKGA